MQLMPDYDSAIRVADLRELLSRFPDAGVVVVNRVGNLSVLDNPDDQRQIGFIELGAEGATVYDEADAPPAATP